MESEKPPAVHPPLPVGTWGSINTRQITQGNVRARVRYRDFDGAIHYVVRHGRSATAAVTALKLALSTRDETFGAAMSPETRLSAAADMWMAEVDASALSAGTKGLYRYVVEHHISGGLGQLRLRELTVPTADRFLKSIAARNGPGAAKSSKSVLSGLLGMAVRHGALAANPVRDTARLAQPRKTVRALSRAEAADLLARARDDQASAHLDLADLIEFLLGTGVRIGEARAIRPPVVHLDAGVVEVNATIVRVKGGGHQIQERPKSVAGWRLIALPSTTVTLARRRLGRDAPRAEQVLFPSPLGRLRDVSNTTGDLRRLLDRCGYPWVTSHVFRKTVATWLDEAGLSARQIADHLGHAKPSLTQDVYMGRKIACAAAGRALESGH